MDDDIIITQDENLDSPKARGYRLRELRQLMRLKRYELSKLVGVSVTSISLWEHATTGKGLTEEGAQKVAKTAKNEGYNCSIPWLLYGIGDSPEFVGLKSFPEKQITKSGNLDKEIEIKYFLSSSDSAVVVEVTDNSMYPTFEKGDWVGGLWKKIENSLDAKKKYIVKIGDNLQVRMIRPTNQFNLYDLYSLSFSENSIHPLELKGMKLEKVAQICRVWELIGTRSHFYGNRILPDF